MRNLGIFLGTICFIMSTCSSIGATDITSNPTTLDSRGGLTLSNGDDSIVIVTSDLYNLKSELDLLEQKYDSSIKNALEQIGTTFSVNEPTFEELINGIVTSQNPRNNDIAMTADNLSLNKVGWVNGNYIIGNGKDVDNAYNKGHSDGYNEGYAAGLSETTNATLQYTYHEHTGNENEIGGCYDYGPTRETIKITVQKEAYDPDRDQTNFWAVCSRCGDIWVGCSWDLWWTQVDHTHLVEKIHLACGKTEETIESATIVFD